MLLFTLIYFIFKDHVVINILTAVGWLINNLFGFALHKFITFQSSDPIHESMLRFLLLSLSSLFCNLVVLNLMLHFFEISPILSVYISTIIVVFIIMILNYFGMDRFIFKNTK